MSKNIFCRRTLVRHRYDAIGGLCSHEAAYSIIDIQASALAKYAKLPPLYSGELHKARRSPNMSKNNIIYHWVMYHLGIYLTIWLFDTYIYLFSSSGSTGAGGENKIVVQTYFLHLCKSATNKEHSFLQKWRHRCRGKKENNKDTKSLYTHA